MAIGVAGTTDYQSRGITQSDSDPAIQGYIEPSYGLGPVLGDAFVNIWSSSDVDFGAGVQGAEIDVAAGIKPKSWSEMVTQHWLGALFLCTGRPNSAYGEVYAKTDYTFGEEDKFTLRGLIFFAPDYNLSGFTGTYVAGGGRVKFWKNFAAYAGVGYQFFEDPNGLRIWSGLSELPTIGSH